MAIVAGKRYDGSVAAPMAMDRIIVAEEVVREVT